MSRSKLRDFVLGLYYALAYASTGYYIYGCYICKVNNPEHLASTSLPFPKDGFVSSQKQGVILRDGHLIIKLESRSR